jgi:glutamate/tyrosine decarboxylase-like PLP-dependent enzyme
VEGYQLLVANSLQNAGFLRHLLMREKGVKCVATANHGPSVGFRLYDPAAVAAVDAEFEWELNLQVQSKWEERVSSNNQYHRAVFKRRGKVALYTSYVQSIAHTHYDEHGHYRLLAGEKAVFMNPLTTYDEISRFVARLHG